MVDAQTLHLLRRASYGPTPASITQAQHLGRKAWLEHQLAPSTIKDAATDQLLTRYPTLTWSIGKVRTEYNGSGTWDVMNQLSQATVARAIWSERQLLEVMVDFWSNHLNVTNPSADVWDSRADYDRTVIRAHALGSFDDLLVAATRHPSMQHYLDNASSSKWQPNENHGRELMELHTVGAQTLYAQADPETDVRDSARILTGLGVDDPSGAAVYRPDWHYVGPVKVLGFQHPNSTAAGGKDVAIAYLRYLARHPATAASIVRKLAVRFVSDSPPATLLAALKATYLKHDTAIVPVLRQLFSSAQFAASAGRKIRRPYEDLVAAVRVLGLRPDTKGTVGIQALYWTLLDMGQAPMAWSPPNGYPDVALAWQSAAGTLARWNAHLSIAGRWWPNTLTGPALSTMVPKKLPATHGEMIDVLSKRLLQRSLPKAQKTAICAFLTDEWTTVTPSAALTRNSTLVGWRLPYVVALLLDSPLHSLR
jgi:uncharacterized protein (DUF1800 family)